VDSYLGVLRKYAVFDGRARRKELWLFALFNLVISLGLALIEGLLAGVSGMFPDLHYSALASLYDLFVLIPGIAVGVRRLHDTGRSGWWLLIAFIPLIGCIVLLVFFLQDGQPGENRFGPNPKGA
jgi:uncharacterized membrane protein YhaH (DUF805 family)